MSPVSGKRFRDDDMRENNGLSVRSESERSRRALDRDEFRPDRHELVNAIASREMERDAGGKPRRTFSHPALAAGPARPVSIEIEAGYDGHMVGRPLPTARL